MGTGGVGMFAGKGGGNFLGGPTFPPSEIAATSSYESGEGLGDELFKGRSFQCGFWLRTSQIQFFEVCNCFLGGFPPVSLFPQAKRPKKDKQKSPRAKL